MHPPRSCEYCGVTFRPMHRGKQGAKQRFCSVRCARHRDADNARGKPKPRRPVVDRFWEYVEMTPGCWLWTGPKANFGYGVLRVDGHPGRLLRAHRFAYELLVGPIPDGLLVLHHCDNPPCVRPDHLYTGTQSDNVRDMNDRGRARHWGGGRKGSAHPQARLDEERVVTIRRRREAGETLGELASAYGVSQTTIADVANRRIWRHV